MTRRKALCHGIRVYTECPHNGLVVHLTIPAAAASQKPPKLYLLRQLIMQQYESFVKRIRKEIWVKL
jgi:hypothetical protein